MKFDLLLKSLCFTLLLNCEQYNKLRTEMNLNATRFKKKIMPQESKRR